MIKRFFILIPFCIILWGCGQPQRILPVIEAPLRQKLLEVPATGVIGVKAGDTIYTLANRYQITPRRIILANSLAPPYDLAGYTSLNVPKPRAHIVMDGDTVNSISERYKVSIADLVRLNDLQEPYELYQGLALSIPRRIDYSLLDLPSTAASTDTETTLENNTNDIQANTGSTTPLTRVAYNPAASRFTWPLDGDVITPFGASARGVKNDGVNIAAAKGTLVRASGAGEVAFVGSGLKAFGNLVLIKHSNGWITAYAHLDSIAVQEGDKISRGDAIGRVGDTGRVNAPQLHFEIRRSRTPVDPGTLLS